MPKRYYLEMRLRRARELLPSAARKIGAERTIGETRSVAGESAAAPLAAMASPGV